MASCREGDTLVATKLERLARVPTAPYQDSKAVLPGPHQRVTTSCVSWATAITTEAVREEQVEAGTRRRVVGVTGSNHSPSQQHI
jgi:hypothetical protein